MNSEEAISLLEEKNGFEFSEEQRKVLEQKGGICLISCAGAGKTSLITSLIAKRTLTGEIDPMKLVATTFSVDGAKEMNDRIDIMLDRCGASWAKGHIKIKTIHALCKQILDEVGVCTKTVTGIKRYNMLLNAIKMAGVRLDKDDVDTLDSLLSYQMNRMLNDHSVVTSARYTLDDIDEATYTLIRQGYAQLKKDAGVIDFEDMLYKAYYVLCLSGRQDILEYFKNKWQYFFIDEAQDTSLIQYKIMQALISDKDKLMMVGDDDQAIYSWRGASPEILLGVCCDYDIKKMFLSTNYRCGRNIVEFSANGVKNNTIREDKDMLAYNSGGSIEFIKTKRSLLDISRCVADKIEELANNGYRYDEICVLSRYNQDLSVLNSILFDRGIYTTIPKEATITYGKCFNDLKGIVDFVNREPWFLDTTSIDTNGYKMFQYMNKQLAKLIVNCMKSTNMDIYDVLKYLSYRDECSELSESSKLLISSIRSRMKYETLSDINTVFDIIDSNGTQEDKVCKLIGHYKILAEWRFKGEWSDRLLEGCCDFFKMMISKYGISDGIKRIKNIEIYEKGGIASIGGKVTLSTCHRSKGREWRVVILMCDDNTTFPSFGMINNMDTKCVSMDDMINWIEEERRLHYVAKTRAKEKLYLACNEDEVSVFTRECFGLIETNNDIIAYAMRLKELPYVEIRNI